MAADQRYCLECGERRLPMSSVLAAGRPAPADQATQPLGGPTPPRPPGHGPDGFAAASNGTLTVIAGIGVLLLAMGVGVLIGRSTAAKPGTAAPQVITVNSGGGGSTASAPSGATFTGDWPSGTKGYTVQLQTLAQPGTAVSAVEAAKTAATAKGAKAVGALKSEEFSSLPAGSYVIYSGVYHTRSEAQKALASLKRSFPSAKVVEVSNASASAGGAPSTGGAGSGSGSNLKNPAPPSVLESLKGAKGKSYVEKSKNLPNVVSTG